MWRGLFLAVILDVLHPLPTHALPSPNITNTNANAKRWSAWTLQESYWGASFFDHWDFWSYADPTHGIVNYQAVGDAWNKGLVYINSRGNPVMQVDHWSNLPLGTSRNSIRIHSQTRFSGGLFILDVAHVPTGCSTWPAFWFNGPDPWPQNGEVDVMEVINDDESNHSVLHTTAGCTLINTGAFSGTILNANCESGGGHNTGCGVLHSSGTAGAAFNRGGGGVYVMQWDGAGIAVWTFKRSEVPDDIYGAYPDPTGWKIPDAAFGAGGCDPYEYFRDMQMIFDITLCGDWAGNNWSSSGCPGSCAETVMTGRNYAESFWEINSLRTFTSSPTSSESNANANPWADLLNVTVLPGSWGERRVERVGWGWGLVVVLAVVGGGLGWGL